MIPSVLDMLNALEVEQRMVAARCIFGAEYGDNMAKLVADTEEDRRQFALVNGE